MPPTPLRWQTAWRSSRKPRLTVWIRRWVYPAGMTEDSEASEEDQEAAELFMEYIQSEEALAVFEEYGFAPYEAE